MMSRPLKPLRLRANGLGANTIANFAGQIATALLGLVFTPLYLHYIGIEAYGVVGLYVALQALFAVLDMGLTATLQRELAVARATDATRMANLVRTLEWVYMPGALVIATSSLVAAGWFATTWIEPGKLTVAQVADGISLLGIAAALQWPAAFHMAGIASLERQVLLNVLKVGFATISAVGCLLFVMATPTLRAYAGWQIVMAAAQSAVYATVLWRAIPSGPGPARFDKLELARNWRFAGAVFALTITSIVLTQADKFVLSAALPLEEFGYYSVAAALAAMLYRLTQPLFTAAGPRYTQLVAANDRARLVMQYHLTNQAMALVLAPTAIVGAVFSHEIVLAWSRDPVVAQNVAPIFRILVISTGLHGMMSLPYALQLAYGWTRLSLYINFISIVVVVPLFVVLGNRYGGVGAAYGWLVLMLGYFVAGMPLVHARLLRGELGRWYLRDLGPPLLGSTIVCGVAALTFDLPSGWRAWIAVALVWAACGGFSAVLSPDTRAILVGLFRRSFPRQRTT